MRDAGVSLEQSIIEQRLAGAAAELGFADPSHFTHRFREAYGTTPRDWRTDSADAQRVPR